MSNSNHKSLKTWNNQDKDCDLHRSPRDGLCSIMTRAKRLCSSRGKITETGCLPVCGTHRRHSMIKAAKCQAFEDCGHRCNRITPFDRPFHLCDKHQGESDTQRCYLLELPAEIRVMIFQCVFSDTPRRDFSEQDKAILSANRLISQEATFALYNESVFLANVTSSSVKLSFKTWQREADKSDIRKKNFQYTLAQVFRHSIVKQIRHLQVDFKLQCGAPGTTSRSEEGAYREEYDLYACRDGIRKLVELIDCPFQETSGAPSDRSRTLKSLTVKPLLLGGCGWSFNEAIAAIFFTIEPFHALRVIDEPSLEPPWVWNYSKGYSSTDYRFRELIQAHVSYIKHRQAWIMAFRYPSSSTNKPHLNRQIAVSQIYTKIEQFVQSLHNHYVRLNNFATAGKFVDLQQFMHPMRVARENNHIVTLRRILDAMNAWWIQYQRNLRLEVQLVNDSIDTIFPHDDIEGADPIDLYPSASPTSTGELIPQAHSPPQDWFRMNRKDSAPELNSPGVTIKRNGTWMTIYQDGKQWVRLNTPLRVRQMDGVSETP